MVKSKRKTERKTKIRRTIREPNFNAIEKVLGKRDLQYLTKINMQKKGNDNALILERIFENILIGNKINSQDLYELGIDLLLIRKFQAQTIEAYNQGEMSILEYNNAMEKLSKTFTQIHRNREDIAFRHVGNQTAEENRKQRQDWIYLVYEALHEIVDNENIERSELLKEFQKKMTDPERVKRYRANNN